MYVRYTLHIDIDKGESIYLANAAENGYSNGLASTNLRNEIPVDGSKIKNMNALNENDVSTVDTIEKQNS